MARLPGVAPCQNTSNTAGYSHSIRKAIRSSTAIPNFPNMASAMLNASMIAPRTSKSISQASARGTGPARRKESSMPSGVEMLRVVSST